MRRSIGGAFPLLVFTALPIAAARAQTPASAASQPASELPADVRTALSRTEDFTFGFAQPGFYAVLEHLKSASTSPGHARPPIAIDNWHALLERPAEFRGLPITIEGVVGRNSAWRFEQEQHRHLDTVWQLELSRPDQPIAATVIFTNDASDIPIDTTIRVTGYFIMVRQYYTASRRIGQAALLVADGPTLVSQAGPGIPTRRDSKGLLGPLVTATAALVIVWFLLRRSITHSRRRSHALRATGPAPISVADDLAAWAARELDQPTDEQENAAAPGFSDESPDPGEPSDAERS